MQRPVPINTMRRVAHLKLLFISVSRRMPESFHVPPVMCPSCGKHLDAASSPDDDVKPSVGDISVCIYCSHICVFGDDMVLRNPTDEEMLQIAGDKQVIAVVNVTADFRKRARENDDD